MDDNKDMNGALSLRERLAGIPSAAVEALKRPQVWGFFLSLAVIAVVAMAFFYPDAPWATSCASTTCSRVLP